MSQNTGARLIGWQKIISEGHMHMYRLNAPESGEPAHRAPSLAIVAGIALIAVAYFAATGNQKLVGWLSRTPPAAPAATAAPADTAPAVAREVVDDSRFFTFINGAITANKAVIKRSELDNPGSLYAGDFKDLPADAAKDFPPAGQPWPVDAVMRRTVGDVTFYGMRLQSADGFSEQVWLGARRVVNGKPTYYSIQSRDAKSLMVVAAGSEVVGTSMIPSAINALTK